MRTPPEPEDLSFALIARLRGHGHLCNVLTHVGSGNWRAIEQAIGSILRSRARAGELTAIARNIVALIADGRGVTGPIMRSVFFEVVAEEAGAETAKRIGRKIARLREGMRREERRKAQRTLQQPVPDGGGENEAQRTDVTAGARASLSKAA
jgi:hypothetical protein